MRRLRCFCVCAVASGLLCGCQSQSDLMRAGPLIYAKISSLWGSDAITRAQVLAVPFATLGVRLGSSGEAMLVLQSVSGDTQRWVGGTQFAIATRNGRILRTVGFAHNVAGLTQVVSPNPAGERNTIDFRYDLADANAYGVAVHCTISSAGSERIEIIGDSHDTEHEVEDCSAPELDWSFRNEFWKDRNSSTIWRSIQYIHPGFEPITLQTLRPVG